MWNKSISLLLLSVMVIASCNEGQIGTENVPPTVESVNPPDGETGVALTTPIEVEFSEQIPPATVRSDRFRVMLVEADSMEQGSYEVEGNIATFVPRDSLLESNVEYRVTVDSIADMRGNKMEGQHTWSFETADVPPRVETVSPQDGAGNVDLGAEISVTFTEPVEPSSINNSSNFRVAFTANDSLENGSYSVSGATATFTPQDSLDNNADYTVTVQGAADMNGNTMTGQHQWEFSTTDTTSSN
jgi:hypothetical protein